MNAVNFQVVMHKRKVAAEVLWVVRIGAPKGVAKVGHEASAQRVELVRVDKVVGRALEAREELDHARAGLSQHGECGVADALDEAVVGHVLQT